MIRKFLTVMACAAVFASCAKDPAPSNENGTSDDSRNPPVEELVPSDGLKDKTFIVNNVSTKTYFDGTLSDAGKVIMKWCADDTIGIWDGTAVRKFHMVSEPIDAAAVFKGRVDENATEFYAIYPYVKDWVPQVKSTEESVYVTVPSVQTVDEDGGVADDAVLALGMVDENDRIAFEIIPALLQYSPTKDEGVVSVSVAAADGLSVTMNVAGGGTFKAGKDYYLAVEHDIFDPGYTVTFSAADGSVVSTQTLEGPLGLAMAEVFPLMGVPEKTYYEMYQDGEDVMIAGKAYNKKDYGDATLVEAGSNFTISATKGVFIIEPGADVTYSPESSLSKMIIIGSNPKQRSTMTQGTHFKVATDGVLAAMNLDINADALTGSTYLFNIYSTNTPLRFALDNCSMTFGNKHFLYHAKETWVSEVAFHNCDIEFTCTENDLWLFNINTATPSVDLFDFQNNVFWHSGTMTSGKGFRITNGSSVSLAKLIFKNNTFVNLTTRDNASSYVSAVVAAAEVSGNIFYFDNQPVNGALLQQACPSLTASDNWYYTAGEQTFNGCNVSGSVLEFTETDGSPFSTSDLTTGRFVKTDAYKNYGAQR